MVNITISYENINSKKFRLETNYLYSIIDNYPGDYLDFALFTSDRPYNDVIFQDATQKLEIVPPNQRHYQKYLGPEFLRARQLVDCRAGAATVQSTISMTLTLLFIVSLLRL